MKNALEWIKTNPFNVGCAVVAIVMIGLFAYLYIMAAPAFSKEKSAEIKQYQSRQRSLMNISVPLPNKDPNADPDIESVVINDDVISEVRDIYTNIRSQYERIRLETSDKNSRRHRGVLLGGNEIWPNSTRNDLFEAALKGYRDHFTALFAYGQANPWGMPTFQASSPPDPALIQQVLATSKFNFTNSIGVTALNELNQDQAQQLFAEQRLVLMKLLSDRARSIHFYVDLPAEEDPFHYEPAESEGTTGTLPSAAFDPRLGGGSQTPSATQGMPAEYPFVIADWAFSDSAPRPDQLWEGQVQLWILRDIMHTIHQLNRVGQNVEVLAVDGTVRPEPANALNSPIKRLLSVRDIPGYVGLHTIGGAFNEDGTVERLGQINIDPGPAPVDLGTTSSAIPAGPSIYPVPPTELAPKKPTEKAAEHFAITPTGRVSSSVFDVRHTRLTIDIEWDKLPLFMEMLGETNFMTVVDADITDLDEYELLKEGYVYGGTDVIRAELLIESLWFREWTLEFMPTVVQQRLLITENQD